MVHLNKVTLLLAISGLVQAGHDLAGHRIRHRREFSSPTALEKRQLDTVGQLQDALDSFLGGDNPSASGNSRSPDQTPPTRSSKAAQAEKTDKNGAIIITDDLETQEPSPTRSSSSVQPEETDKNGAIIITDDLETESASSQAPTSTPKPSNERSSSTREEESSTRDEESSSTQASSIEIGDPTSSQATSSEQEPTKTRKTETQETESATSSKEEEEESSIIIGEPSTETKTHRPTSTREQEEASSTAESSAEEKPTKSIEIEDPESSTRRSTREEEATSTRETETETETQRPTQESSIVIGDPTSSEEITWTRSSTVEEETSSRTRTSATKDDGGISISIDLPSLEPTKSATRTRTREEESSIASTEESSSSDPTRTRSSSVEESSSISIDDPAPESQTEEPTITRSSTRERESSSTREGSISIGFPSIVPNTTDESSVTRSNTRTRLDPSSEQFESFTNSATVSTDGPRGNSTRSSTFEENASSTFEENASSTAQPGTGAGDSSSARPTRSEVPSGAASNSEAASQVAPTGSSSETDSSRGSVTEESSTRRPNSFYDFVPTSTLIVNTETSSVTTERPSPTGSVLTGASAAEESISSVSIATALPSSLPAKIVPGDAPPETPEDSTLVSLLFQVQTLGWKWLVSSPDTAGQVFAYMPNLLAAALNISESDVQNTALVAYQSLTDTEATQLMTVYLAALPTDQLSNLQAQIKTPSSQLYSQTDPILNQLSQQLVATFPVNAFTSTEQATIGQTPADPDEDKKTDKKGSSTTVIAVVASFGSVIVLLLAFIAFRYYKRSKAGNTPNLRALQLGHESPSAHSPAMSQRSPANRHAFSGLFTSHHYATSRSSRHSVGSDSSGHSSDRSAGHNNREVQRGISWYSGRYTDFGEDENGSPRSRSVYGQAITQDLNAANNPFADRQAIGEDDEAAWLARSEGVRRLKTGQVQISRPQLEGNSLML